MVKTLIIAAALIVWSVGITLAQDAEKGATLFKQCSPEELIEAEDLEGNAR
jgi:hypothetical protein